MEWGTFSSVHKSQEDNIEFKQEGFSRVVNYFGPPLPLNPPNPVTTYPDAKVSIIAIQNQSLVLEIPNGPRILCYSSNSSTLTVGHLSSNMLPSVFSEGKTKCQSFEEWSHGHSMLLCNHLKCRDVCEPILLLDSVVVEGMAYLCVACSRRVIVYKVQSSGALSGDWLDQPSVHKCGRSVLCAKLNPYVAGQVLVGTENGGIFLYQPKTQILQIRVCVGVERLASMTCLFGAHPRLILWVERGRLYSTDLRSTELPLCSLPAAVSVGDDTEDIVCIVSVSSHQQPFHCLMATRTQLLLVDVRQPSEPVLAVLHHLTQPPVHIAELSLSAGEGSLVLVASANSHVLFGYKCVSSFYALVTVPPHTVCLLGDILRSVKSSELYALTVSQAEYRLRYSIVGMSLLHLQYGDTCCYGAMVVTELGDVFYQCWQYSAAQPGPVFQLNTSHILGLKLWIQEAYLMQKEVLLASDRFLPMTVKDMSSVAQYLVTGQALGEQWVCPRCHISLSGHPSHCEMPQQQHINVLDIFKGLYQELVPSNNLDIAMVTDWERIDMNDLFEEEGDT